MKRKKISMRINLNEYLIWKMIPIYLDEFKIYIRTKMCNNNNTQGRGGR